MRARSIVASAAIALSDSLMRLCTATAESLRASAGRAVIGYPPANQALSMCFCRRVKATALAKAASNMITPSTLR